MPDKMRHLEWQTHLGRLLRQITCLLTLIYILITATLYNSFMRLCFGPTTTRKSIGKGEKDGGVGKLRRTMIGREHECVIVVCGTGGGLSREVALRFASSGYNVFTQCTGASTLTTLLYRWESIKSRRGHQPPLLSETEIETEIEVPLLRQGRGTLHPLTFSSEDVKEREKAMETVKAYVKSNKLTLTAIVNVVDSTSRSVRRGSVTSDLMRQRSSSGSSEGKSGMKKVSRDDSLYEETPIPLSIATEDHLNHLCKQVNGSLTIIQDLLDLMRKDKARVLNIWASSGGAGLGPLPAGALSVPEASFKAMTRTLAFELRPFGIFVSLVLPGGTTVTSGIKSSFHHPTLPTISVTNDVRSILSVDVSPFVRAVFDTQVKVFGHLRRWSNAWKVDDRLVFEVLKAAIEIDYPKYCYPIGIDQLVASWTNGVIPDLALGWVYSWLYSKQNKWAQ